MLNSLMIDFNIGVILQMNLQLKVDLKKKLRIALKNREKLSQAENLQQIGPIGKHLSDNDLNVL